MSSTADTKMWANSGDSHLVEPRDLFDQMPQHLREKMPQSVKDPGGDFETVYIDGQSFRRQIPKPGRALGTAAIPEGIDPSEFITRAIGGNDAEKRLTDLDNEGIWGEVIYPSLGIWTSNIRTPEVVKEGARFLNDWAIAFQRKSPRFVCAASGPFVADRMDEGYRQHGASVHPKLSKLPSRYLYEQVYASFQHDRSAVFANIAMGWNNVMWGSDYPHFEGTFGHTQKTLHELFDDLEPAAGRRIRIGAFQELFPHVPPAPADQSVRRR